MAITYHGQGDAGDKEPNHAYGDEEAITSIRETHMFDMNVGVDANITSLEEEAGVRGWYENRAPSPLIFSSAGKQSRRRDATKVVEEGLVEMEMSVDATQAATQSTGQLMWADFASAVRTLLGSICGGGNAVGGGYDPSMDVGAMHMLVEGPSGREGA